MVETLRDLASPPHVASDAEIRDDRRSELYDRLRREQLAQIEQAVAEGQYSVAMCNVTQDAQQLLESYGYRETDREWGGARRVTYTFSVDSFERWTAGSPGDRHYKEGLALGSCGTACCLVSGYMCARCVFH
jgi:hypothetical protein